MPNDPTALDISEHGQQYVLARDAAGWGIWRIDALDEAVIRYADGDDAYQQASDFFHELERRHRAANGGWLVALRLVALIAGVVWVALHTYYYARSASVGDSFNSIESLNQLRWMQAAAEVAYAIFLFSAVAHIILWLRRRDDPRA